MAATERTSRRPPDLRSSLPYINVPDPRCYAHCAISDGARSPNGSVSINLEVVEMPSKSPKRRSRRNESPLAQYALFPLPPSRPPLSASPLSPYFRIPPLGSQPMRSPSPSTPNTSNQSSLETLQPPNRVIVSANGMAEQLDGLGISHVLDDYRFGSNTPTAMARDDTAHHWDDDEDSCSLASSTDISIYAMSTSSSSSLDLHETSINTSGNFVPSWSQPKGLPRSTISTSSLDAEVMCPPTHRRTTSLSSTASSPDSLLDFDMLVSVARKGEADAAARRAEQEAEAAARLAEGEEREKAAWQAFQEDQEELQEEEADFGATSSAQWQDSARSMASLRNTMSRPEMRSRQSTSATIRPPPKRKIVFDEPSSSDEEAFDLTLDVSQDDILSSPPSSTYTRSPASSFGFSRRASNATDASVSAASSSSTHLAVPAEPLPVPRPEPATAGHKKGLSSPPLLQQQHLKPLQLPVRVAEHKRQQSVIKPLALQGRKAILPAISWAESPPRPERTSSLAHGGRKLHTAASTPNLRSRLPTIGRRGSSRFDRSTAETSMNLPGKHEPASRLRLPSAPASTAPLADATHRRGASAGDVAFGLSSKHALTAKPSQPSRLLEQPEEATEILPLRHTNKLRSPRARMPSSNRQDCPVSSELPSLNRLRGFRSIPVLRPTGETLAFSSTHAASTEGSEMQDKMPSPRSSMLSALVRGGSSRKSLLPMRSPRQSLGVGF